jgi:DNA-binding beta-propeller fold protein YncE
VHVTRWYLTFHGGDHEHAWNNIHSFGEDGSPLGKVLQTDALPAGTELRELRGFAFGPSGDLYVTNAWKGGSHILRFAAKPSADGRHDFIDVFVERHADNPGLSHPFDVAFGPEGHLYVPCQDTNVVGRYFGPSSPQTAGDPMPIPPALKGLDDPAVPPGTFVPSSHHASHGLSAVRGALFGPAGHLYVVDRDDNAVKAFDGLSGEHVRTYRHEHLDHPIHLLSHPDGERVLVGSRDRHAVVAIDVDTGKTHDFVAPGHGGLGSPSGMAIGPDGLLYVASRDTKQVLRFDARTGKPEHRPFIDHLDDFPEFLQFVDQT